MKTNESERLRSLTNDWKINSLFLEPPEMVGIKPQTSDDNLTSKNIMALILIVFDF